MRFHAFGDTNTPVILLLPGTCCHWRANFGAVIPLLEKDFRVVCVSYDGLDETEQTVFPDLKPWMLTLALPEHCIGWPIIVCPMTGLICAGIGALIR